MFVAATAAVGAIALSSSADAGGFALREQSVMSQGASFAGSAAGGSLSSMFWNPAAAGVRNGMNSESNVTLVVPHAEIDVHAGSTLDPLGTQSVDIGHLAALSASYYNYQLSDRVWLGLAITTPFGLTTKPDNLNWAGQFHSRTAKLLTINVNPNVAVKVAPGLMLGVGVQAQFADLTLKRAYAVNSPSATLEGDDIAWGFTAGVLWQPHAGTSVGLGYRSAIRHKFEGDFSANGLPVLNTPISAKIDLPDIVTFSFMQAMSDKARLLGTVEWSNWSVLDQVNVVPTGPGGFPGTTLDFGWHSDWFFALGMEYDWRPDLTLRAGLAYEISPIRNPDERTPAIPDADRTWLSIGASYKWSESTTLDFAYTHVFVADAPIDRVESGVRLVGEAHTSVDLVSVALRMKLGGDRYAPLK